VKTTHQKNFRFSSIKNLKTFSSYHFILKFGKGRYEWIYWCTIASLFAWQLFTWIQVILENDLVKEMNSVDPSTKIFCCLILFRPYIKTIGKRKIKLSIYGKEVVIPLCIRCFTRNREAEGTYRILKFSLSFSTMLSLC